MIHHSPKSLRLIRPVKVLDLFCGAGGAAMGLHQAWPEAEITGIDIKPQPRYPFRFIQADATAFPLNDYDFIWASPPCQAYTTQGRGRGHPELIIPTRELLINTHKSYVIENVIGAPLLHPVLLCGSMFDLGVRRHRHFEASFTVPTMPCRHNGHEIRAYYGAWGREAFRARKPGNKDTLRGTVERAPQDMGIDWMTWAELTQAIPPAYSEWIARHLTQ
jgi:DNA (cytosine-5)-methyltransferase 1